MSLYLRVQIQTFLLSMKKIRVYNEYAIKGRNAKKGETMEITKKKINIAGIPAIIWGNNSDKIFIHVHGKMSKKEYAEQFAVIAEKKGYQTISFDLPEHGERTDRSCRCDVWNGMKDLTAVADYVYENWAEVSLFACSLGAYFALNTYSDRKFEKILFQSPIVDMKWLVDHMMLWSDITEERLKCENEIETPIDTLRWDYYTYICEHPVNTWHEGTYILYGQLDNLQPLSSIRDFSDRYKCRLTVSEGSEHAFMAERDFEIVSNWMSEAISK